MAGVHIGRLEQVRLSANWMAAAGYPGEDAALYDTVRAVAMELCPELGLAIPVGKDSMSMRTVWRDREGGKSVAAPLSLIISAFAPVLDVRKTLTPQLRLDKGASQLLLIDLGLGANRLGASALAQVYRQLGDQPADLHSALNLKAFFNFMQQCLAQELLLAYHDRSDGGLIVTLLEMAFAGHCGLDLRLDDVAGKGNAMDALFSEELGAVIQVADDKLEQVLALADEHGLADLICRLGTPLAGDEVSLGHQGETLLSGSRQYYQRLWSATSYQIARLRDNPDCAQEEYDSLLDEADPGLSAALSFDVNEDIAAPYVMSGRRPRVAVLREQGVNGQLEMAAAFHRAGFDSFDLHMSDIIAGRQRLDDFNVLVACGGFSYGDVLGAGGGWAKSILFNSRARREFEAFFARPSTLALGVCNGCQMFSTLRELIPGTGHWPRFVRNRSERFEARTVLVKVEESLSAFTQGMHGSVFPIAIAHGEGRAEFHDDEAMARAEGDKLVALRLIDNHGLPTERYPANPSGTPAGITGLCSADGRVTIMMPHPERVFRTVTNSWHPDDWDEDGPTLRLFRNARAWLG